MIGKRQEFEAAKQKGIYKGRPVTLDYEKIRVLKSKGLGTSEIAKTMCCSRGAVYKILSAKEKRHRSSDRDVQTSDPLQHRS